MNSRSSQFVTRPVVLWRQQPVILSADVDRPAVGWSPAIQRAHPELPQPQVASGLGEPVAASRAQRAARAGCRNPGGRSL